MTYYWTINKVPACQSLEVKKASMLASQSFQCHFPTKDQALAEILRFLKVLPVLASQTQIHEGSCMCMKQGEPE